MIGLKRIRLKALMKQTEVAKMLGVTQSTISMWETGAAMPRTDMLPKIARLFGCSVDDLLKQE